MTDFQVNGKHYCKVCDEWVTPGEAEEHCKKHVAELVREKKKEKAERPKEFRALTCSVCNRNFEVERKRGRPPTKCPEHQTKVKEVAA